jgi:hypothetical protein
VEPALFSGPLAVELLELLAAVELPLVGPLPASFVEMEPLVGPLPASAFGCANAGTDTPRAIAGTSKALLNADMTTSSERLPPIQLDLIEGGSRFTRVLFPVSFRRLHPIEAEPHEPQASRVGGPVSFPCRRLLSRADAKIRAWFPAGWYGQGGRSPA